MHTHQVLITGDNHLERTSLTCLDVLQAIESAVILYGNCLSDNEITAMRKGLRKSRVYYFPELIDGLTYVSVQTCNCASKEQHNEF